MTGTRKSSTADHAVAKVPSGAESCSRTDRIEGVDSTWVIGSSCASALTGSARSTEAAATTTAGLRLALGPWPLTIRGYPAPDAGSAGRRFFTEEANDDRGA